MASIPLSALNAQAPDLVEQQSFKVCKIGLFLLVCTAQWPQDLTNEIVMTEEPCCDGGGWKFAMVVWDDACH